jgi:hypothetical protein
LQSNSNVRASYNRVAAKQFTEDFQMFSTVGGPWLVKIRRRVRSLVANLETWHQHLNNSKRSTGDGTGQQKRELTPSKQQANHPQQKLQLVKRNSQLDLLVQNKGLA